MSYNLNDKYSKLARQKKLRSRAWFKIEEIQKKEKIFFQGLNVVDLGSSPGGWSYYVSSILKNTGFIIACDILPMRYIKGVSFLQGDIREKKFFNNFIKICKKKSKNYYV